MAALLQTDLKSLQFLHRGKVRDLYAVSEDKLLIIQTDRLSAFDVILAQPIPDKGRILTAMSNFWFGKLGHIIPTHMTGIDPLTVVAPHERDQVADRAVVVRRLTPLKVEAVARGYIIGSGWKDYQRTGKVCGIALPPGLREAEKLPEPLFTPSTKAEAGHHDENIAYAEVERIIGAERARQVRDATLALYNAAAQYAASKGIIIADTKFEFGVDAAGTVHLMDEALTPDSSRFWDAAQYRVGTSPASFDKQIVRNWLEQSGWNKTPPPPMVPEEVLQRTADRYNEALRLLTGKGIEA